MKYLIVLLFVFSLPMLAGDLTNLEVGKDVPSFTLKNYDGKEVALKSLLKENKFTVLMFISTECPVSNGYNERMEKLYETFNKKGVAVVGINANKAEDVTMIAAHCKEHGFKFPVLKDRENKIADLYGALVTPETFVIDPAGKLVYHGRIDDSRNLKKVTSNDLVDALDKLLSGKTVAQKEARAFGCTIKRLSDD